MSWRSTSGTAGGGGGGAFDVRRDSVCLRVIALRQQQVTSRKWQAKRNIQLLLSA
jgi:hypothetical protein